MSPTRATGPSSCRTSSRAASSPRRVRRKQHVADAPRLLATGRQHDLGEQVGQAGDDRLGQLLTLGRQSAAPGGRRVRSARECRVGLRGHALTRGSSSTAIACPSGISWVWQGASRASRSTRRSTVIFAIRRHVVSLPPVIVIIPDEVSYSSALREMSTDFLGRRSRSADARPRTRPSGLRSQTPIRRSR